MNNRLMIAGLMAGLVLGLSASATGNPLLLDVSAGVAPLGDVFIRALQMVVIPLVMTIVFAGVARLGDTRTLGRMGGTALAFIVVTTAIGVIIGMTSMGLALTLLPVTAAPMEATMTNPELPGIIDFLVNLVPRNPFAAASEGRLLPLLVFSVLFGAATGTLDSAPRTRLLEVADAISDAFIKLVHWILWTAPVGIFALAAPATARMGMDLIRSLAVFVITVIVALLIFMAVVYIPAVVILGRTRPGDFIRKVLPSYTMGFTTTSSVATLPVLLRDAPSLGISRKVADLVLPLAASLNRAGSGLFQGASVVYLAWLYGIDVPGSAWIGAALACFFAAATVAPVPSASIMTMAPALAAVGVPMGGLGILLGVDRIPDMFRSGANNAGHMVAALVTEGRAGDGVGSSKTATPETAIPGTATPPVSAESSEG